MSTSPLGLIRPKPRKFEDLAREEMRRQQLLLSNRSQNETENSKSMDDFQSQRLNHGRIEKQHFYGGQAKVAPDATDLPSSVKKLSKEAKAPIGETVDRFAVDQDRGAVLSQNAGNADTSYNNNHLFYNLPRINVPLARNFRSDDTEYEPSETTSPPSYRSPKTKMLQGEKIKHTEANSGKSCSDFPYLPKASTFDLHNEAIQRSASLSLSSDDGEVQEHHRQVKDWTINRSNSDSVAVEAMHKLNFQQNYKSSLGDAIIFPSMPRKMEGHFSATAKAPQYVDGELNDDHDSDCTNSEKYVSSDTDNDDASTITRSSGGNEASSEAEDIVVGVDDEDEENCDCNDGGGSYDEEIRSDEGRKQLTNRVKGSHLQQALKRLATLSRSAQNTLSKGIISKTWFSSDRNNGTNTPSSSLPPPRFGSFTGDSDSLRYSSMDSFTSAVNYNNNSNHSSFVASGIFGFIGNVTSNSSVATYSSSDVVANAEVPPLLLSTHFSCNSHAVSSVRLPSEGGNHAFSRDIEKQLHSQLVSTVPPNLPRSKNRGFSHSDQPESSTQPKYILIGNGKKNGRYGSFESNRFSQADVGEEVVKNNRLLKPSEKTALVETRNEFNLHEDYKIEADEEAATVCAEDIVMGQELYTFHTYFWRGVIIMSVACFFIFLLILV